MGLEVIGIKVGTATLNDIYLHLMNCDNLYMPPLSNRVNPKEYAQKLFKHSVTVEAWSNLKLIGLVAIYLNSKETTVAYISNCSVLAKFENRGIATSMLNETSIYAKKLGFTEIALEVNGKNTKAIEFYIKKGYKSLKESGDTVLMRYVI